MALQKILVTGATGFIGTRLCEKLTLHYRLPYRALVRRFTKANRIARMGAEMVGGDLLKPATVRAALEGCDAVVHLAHSEDASAPKETSILLQACRSAGVKRLVHVSSISVHGPNPGPECAREETATIGRYGEEYCDAKAKVEERVRKAIDDGRALSGVILRPGVVYGPYGPFVMGAIDRAKGGEVSLIDGGSGACNAVYVDDVCDAIHVALTTANGLGQAFFVTGDESVNWKDFTLTFANMIDSPPAVREFASAEVRADWALQRPTLGSNVRSLFRLAASPRFHRELSAVPFFKSSILGVKRKLVKVLSEEQKLVLKSRIQVRHPKSYDDDAPAWPDPGQLVRETCRVRFSNELAKRELGWRPKFSFQQGAEMTRTWLSFARLIGSKS